MAKIAIPESLRHRLGPEMKMDVHWIDVKLNNGSTVKNLVVRGGAYITGHADDPNGEGALSFSSAEIKTMRRHSFLPFW